MKAFVLQHLYFENLGNLHAALERAGFSIEYFSSVNPEHLNYIDKNPCDLLVVLGGPVGVYQDSAYPYLNTEKRLIEKQINKEKSVIGICLGCQLIASVLGARVYPGGGKEIGWGKVQIVDAALESPFNVLDNHHVLHWHGDTFELPHDAKSIAASSYYLNQGFTYGEHVLALQFHIEVQPHRIEDWLIGHACELSELPDNSVQNIRQDSQLYAPILQPLAEKMWDKWLAKQVARL